MHRTDFITLSIAFCYENMVQPQQMWYVIDKYSYKMIYRSQRRSIPTMRNIKTKVFLR